MGSVTVSFPHGKLTNGSVFTTKSSYIDDIAIDGISTERPRIGVEDYLHQKPSLSEASDGNTFSCAGDDDKDTSPPYPELAEIPNTYDTFFLGHGGLPESKRAHAIAVAKRYHADQKSRFLGYQLNFDLDYQSNFASYLDTHVNNVGDPFKESNVTVNSKFMERAVLDYYAELWNAKWPHNEADGESYWGFCLSMGSTEGNLYTLWSARDYLSGMKISVNEKLVRRRGHGAVKAPRLVCQEAVNKTKNPHSYTPITFYSQETHYSIAKAMTMLRVRSFHDEGEDEYPSQCPITDDGAWPAEVPSHEAGGIDIDCLATLVEFFACRGYPIIVCFNYGTTFKGAYDDVDLACHRLAPILQKYNLLEREIAYDERGETKVERRTGYWFHVDGALGAAYMPYVEMAYSAGRISSKGPDFDFRLPMVHSIAMSGHKWIGATVPCGIYMTRVKYRTMPSIVPGYIGTPDTTFAGSRNGLSPILLWDNIARNSYEKQMERALKLEELAAYTEQRLRYLQDEVLRTDLYVERSPLSLTVRFKRASDDLCRKYSLSSDEIDGRRYSHVFLMQHVTKELIDSFIQDLAKEMAFAPHQRGHAPPCIQSAYMPKLGKLQPGSCLSIPSCWISELNTY
ncbi:hypothetical protein KP509_38G050700 [Ceratopteris richardii]|uniref:Histidine decarboxylase n=1 Tax=Ceratopteris richardii TaxID=49495 RepID=A0A8T2Q4P3_CERRI|nr:hypothetical protein KP509_38G050700 [Ceratopteris richardii]